LKGKSPAFLILKAAFADVNTDIIEVSAGFSILAFCFHQAALAAAFSS
jgi:hypothetical protein